MSSRARSTSGIPALHIGSDLNQIIGVAVGGHDPRQLAHQTLMFSRCYAGRTRLTDGKHIDGGKVSLLREPPRKLNMTIRQGAHGVGNRLVWIVAFHENGVKTGNASLSFPTSRPLEQAREQRKY